ncbi:NADH-quinone oxidoreductase subunit M [Wolbachia endosymbiont of Howardula sp.]|nr:NADH-quinone oxidoreductase subunit M [Wolbachia endosymbiont of Howardula sp.]UWI83219.1 NADH-quinone oxidoreductase subunit M [Wolbachia endosymbiont of Howardula sp.]
MIKVNVHSQYIIRYISLFCVLLTFFLSLIVLIKFDYQSIEFQLISYPIKHFGVGVDGLSLLFLILTTFLFVICIFYNIQIYNLSILSLKLYIALFLLLESFIIGFFISLHITSFYIFFEAVLIPMFFIIGIWGGRDRIYATFKLFLYTLTGSLLLLIGLIYMYSIFHTSDIQKLSILVPQIDFRSQLLLWILFFIAFAIKVPMIPFHTWLPDVHVQSPTSGSIILAGLLIKMGGYGFLRLSIPMLPQASIYFSQYVICLSIIGIIYSSLIAFAQSDMKKLISYSSISHMGFVTAGLFSFCEEGILGAIFQMISHGLISTALFLCIGILYSRFQSLKIAQYSGLAHLLPKFSIIFMILTMAAIGLPGTCGFIGEFLSMLGIFARTKFIYAGFITLGTILSALYMLNLCKQIIWGINTTQSVNIPLSGIEYCILIMLVTCIIILGIYPTLVFHYLKPFTLNLLMKYHEL